MTKIPIVEVFGPVLQGEGALLGQSTHFVRVGGCDYACSWCDTPDAVIPERVRAKATQLEVPEVLDLVAMLRGYPKWITISGGNPLLFNLRPLVEGLQNLGYRVAVETQGSLYKPWIHSANLVTISPKGPSSGMDSRFNEDAVNRLIYAAQHPILKIPVADYTDLMWAIEIFSKWPSVRSFVQPVRDPEHDTIEDQLKKLNWLACAVMEQPAMRNVVVLPQLHALIGSR